MASPTIWTWPRRWQSGSAPKKYMTHWAGVSFADWLLEDVVRTILLGSGVPYECVSFTLPPGLVDTLKLPCERKWERRFAYSAETGIVQALDEIVASVGCRWRVTRDGIIDVWMPTPWNGIPDWELTDAVWNPTVFAQDTIESITNTYEPDARRNVVQHLATDRAGNLVIALCHDWESLFDEASERWVGDDCWSVKQSDAGQDPTVTALAELERRRVYQYPVTWTWPGHPAWKPWDTVRIAVEGIGVPVGTVLQIVSKESRVSRREMRYVETVTAGYLGVQI